VNRTSSQDQPACTPSIFFNHGQDGVRDFTLRFIVPRELLRARPVCPRVSFAIVNLGPGPHANEDRYR
jgi:hypothetical protein